MKYVFQLTWLRGGAAFLVICTHVLKASDVSYGTKDLPCDFLLFKLLDLGLLGVLLFFTLSGATLYLSNSNVIGSTRSSSFFVKRFFRIWPAFVVSLFIYIIFNQWFKEIYLQSMEVNGYWIEQHLREYGILDISRYLLLLFDFPETRDTLFNGAYWSLPIEFHYYLMFPVLCYIIYHMGTIGGIVCGIVMLAMGGGLYIIYDLQQFFLIYAYTFIGGMLLSRFYKRSSMRIPSWVSMIVLFLLLCLASIIRGQVIAISHKYHPLIFGGISIVMVGVTLFSRMKPTASMIGKGLVHYGRISYSTYLFHQLFIASAVLFSIKCNIYGNNKYLFVLSVTFCGSLLLASLTFKYIERPWIVFSKGLVEKNGSSGLSGLKN